MKTKEEKQIYLVSLFVQNMIHKHKIESTVLKDIMENHVKLLYMLEELE